MVDIKREWVSQYQGYCMFLYTKAKSQQLFYAQKKTTIINSCYFDDIGGDSVDVRIERAWLHSKNFEPFHMLLEGRHTIWEVLRETTIHLLKPYTQVETYMYE